MDKLKNPFNPGAGRRPPYLAGRENEISEASLIIKKLKSNKVEKSMAIYGLRGVGKTVLLNEFQKIADQEGLLTEHVEISEKEDFRKMISRIIRKIILKISPIEKMKENVKNALRALKSFTLAIPDGPEFSLDIDKFIGHADSGNTTQDLIDLFISLGEAALEANKQICIFIDEVQYLENKDFSALLSALHRLNQKEYPILLMVAGLPQIAGLAGEAKSYAERLFNYIKIDSLVEEKAREALVTPVLAENVTFNEEALQYVLKKTGRYPYYIQAFGKEIWDLGDNPISLTNAIGANEKFISQLDDGFFKVRLDRTTSGEKQMMKAMASIGKGPYKMSQVADKRGLKINSLSPHRSSLIKKGLIYSPDHNQIEFTVPLFDDFIRRSI
jgi:AAA+ ATPase superfamily predicted ATPase